MAGGTGLLSRLSGVERAAMLLFCLGEEATARIFERLDDSEVRKISRCMMAIEHVPADVAKQVIDHFLKAEAELAGLFVRGDEFVRKAIANGNNRDRKDALMSQLDAGASFRPLETIAMMDPRMVAGILEREHPQTVALVLSTQSPEHTRMAKIDKVSPEVINGIEESLRREIGAVVSSEQQQVGGVDKVVDILGRMGKGRDKAILNVIDECDADLAEIIRRKMFTFEDLSYIDTRGLQSLLREVNNDVLVIALKTASEELTDKLFSCISSRAVDMIKEDMAAMAPVRLVDVEEAQQQIIQIALKLQEEGKVVIPGRGVSDVLV
ncbi:MAG: flagellar motor switch protein FliG [Desulfuromonadaceae bacterium]